MKNLSTLLAGAVLALGFAGAAHADRSDHFKGKSAETLTEAVAIFSEYNTQLAAVLAKDSLATADVVKVHELTYTLENALEKIRDELDDLADTLEDVHVASEKQDAAKVKKKGQKYLQTAREVIQ